MKHFSPGRVALAIALVCASACGKSRTRAPDPEPGAPCSIETGCTGGLSCVEDPRLPEGICTARCDTPCPLGSSCAEEIFGGLCLSSCETDEDCREGYVCHRSTCRPPCTDDRECGEGYVCRDEACTAIECTRWRDCAADERCVAGDCVIVLDGGGFAGSMCERALDCASGLCLPERFGRVCGEPCTRRADCSFEDVCIPVETDVGVRSVCVPANREGRFLAGACDAHDECESWTCLDHQCRETCASDEDCLAGQVCAERLFASGTFSTCDYEAREGDVTVAEIDLGSVPVSAATPPRRINLGIPNDAVSVTFMATVQDGDRVPLTFVDVFDPRNEPLFELAEIAMFHDQPIRFLPVDSEEVITMLVPNSTPDRVELVPGRFGVSIAMIPDGLSDPRTATARLVAKVKRARSVEGGALSLHVHLVGVGLSAADAPSDVRLTNALAELEDVFASTGIRLEGVTFFDVSPEDAERFQVIDSTDGPDSELAGLFRTGAPRSGQAVDVFLVRSIAGGGRSITLGIAGGIPGPVLHGTMHGGVAVSFDPSVVGSDDRGSRNIAQIASHEIAHYLGLYHVRERLDPCPEGEGPSDTLRCAPFGGGDVLADTTESSGANLMWWSLGGADGRTYNVELTSGQGFVVRRSALVGP